MAETAPIITILCSQCSRHARIRRGDPLPDGWVDHYGQLSCSDSCRDILLAMGLIAED